MVRLPAESVAFTCLCPCRAPAAALLNGAWQVLGQGEYLAALLLTLFCLVVGIGAALAITIRAVKYIAFVIVVVAGRKNL